MKCISCADRSNIHGIYNNGVGYGYCQKKLYGSNSRCYDSCYKTKVPSCLYHSSCNECFIHYNTTTEWDYISYTDRLDINKVHEDRLGYCGDFIPSTAHFFSGILFTVLMFASIFP